MLARIYLDAVGRANEVRTWGALAAVGDSGHKTVEKVMSGAVDRNGHLCEESGELKGKALPDSEITRVAQELNGSDVFFWGIPVRDKDSELMVSVRRMFIEGLRALRPHRGRKDWRDLETRKRNLVKYLDLDLKDVNQHKYLCIALHATQLVELLAARDRVKRLTEVEVMIDRENFPNPSFCAWGLKWWIAAQLQGRGMHYSLNGNAPHETCSEGNVRVNADADSKSSSGLQLVDILAQGVFRKVPGYTLIDQ